MVVFLNGVGNGRCLVGSLIMLFVLIRESGVYDREITWIKFCFICENRLKMCKNQRQSTPVNVRLKNGH